MIEGPENQPSEGRKKRFGAAWVFGQVLVGIGIVVLLFAAPDVIVIVVFSPMAHSSSNYPSLLPAMSGLLAIAAGAALMRFSGQGSNDR